MDLPEFLSPPPEKEALSLALDSAVFDGLDGEPPLKAYLLLDASQSADIAVCAEALPEPARCLFDGAAFEDLGDVGPWLFELKRYGAAWEWFVDDGWGQNWGYVILSRLTMAKLKVHLKKFTKVTDEDGETYFFKFYRPEHLNTFIPAFEPEQQTRFMEGIEAILAEKHEMPETLLTHKFSIDAGFSTEETDLVATGKPLMVQSPSPDDVEKILADL